MIVPQFHTLINNGCKFANQSLINIFKEYGIPQNDKHLDNTT